MVINAIVECISLFLNPPDIEKTHCTERLYLTEYETVTLRKPDVETDPWSDPMFCGRAEPGIPPFIIPNIPGRFSYITYMIKKLHKDKSEFLDQSSAG